MHLVTFRHCQQTALVSLQQTVYAIKALKKQNA